MKHLIGTIAFAVVSLATAEPIPLKQIPAPFFSIYEMVPNDHGGKKNGALLLTVHDISSFELLGDKKAIRVSLGAEDAVKLASITRERKELFVVSRGGSLVAPHRVASPIMDGTIVFGEKDSPTLLVAEYIRERLGVKAGTNEIKVK